MWRVYKITAERLPDGSSKRDRVFLARCFQKLLLNFTWWVNRKDPTGKNLFSGGFLGLDNIGVFDRSQPLPTGGHLEQADGTAWMAFYCGTMLSMALELAKDDPAYEDIATKFFEHFIAITDAMNTLGGTGLWDEHDGFYYDQIRMGDQVTPLRVRSLVGMIPLLAVEILETDTIEKLPDFKRRMEWFLKYRTDLPWATECACAHSQHSSNHRLLAIPTRERLVRTVLLVEALERYQHYYGDSVTVQTRAGQSMTFGQAADEIRDRLTGLFLPDESGARPCHEGSPQFASEPHWKNLVYFHEHFHAETGRGLGATHQTGWTALVLEMLRPSSRNGKPVERIDSLHEGTVSVRRHIAPLAASQP